MKKSIVLLSGGLDSTVSLAQAILESRVELCLTFDYGQKAAQQEIKAAKLIANHYQLDHEIIQLPFLKEITNTALVNIKQEIPAVKASDLDNCEKTNQSAGSVWVPNRNNLFVNIAAAYADALNCRLIIAGFNKEEAETFTDNSFDFVKAVNKSLYYSTRNKAELVSYTQFLNKEEIIELGLKYNVPFKHIWSCYNGGDSFCEQCESCQRFMRAAGNTNLIKIIRGRS